MLNRHFQFSPGDWPKQESLAFASHLRLADSESRDRICQHFGLKLIYRKDGLVVEYEGKHVGMGSFTSDGVRISFVIQPKVDDFQLKALFDCLTDEELGERAVQITPRSTTTLEAGAQNELDWTFYSGLLSEIDSFGLHHLNIFNNRSLVELKGTIRGRPQAASLIQNQIVKKPHILCEVLDNYRQRQYATFFLATARSLRRDLKDWHSILHRTKLRPDATYFRILSRLKPYANLPFSRVLIRELGHPPYPYGIKQVIQGCLQYWRHRGILGPGAGRESYGCTGTAFALDDLFEVYTRRKIADLFPAFKHLSKARYPFRIELNDPRNSGKRDIEPDMILVDENSQTMMIGEAKYSNNLCPREHVAQLLAYLNFQSFNFAKGYRRIGVLIYPGNTLDFGPIRNFEKELLCLTLPVKLDPLEPLALGSPA